MSAELKREFELYDYGFSGDIRTVEIKAAFLDAYREYGSIYHAAKECGAARSSVYRWIESDPAFVTALDDCREDCYDKAETSVYKKALAGDSLLLMFYLKAHRHKFRDKMTLDIPAIQDEIRQRMQAMPTNISPQFPLAPRLLQKDNNNPDSNES